MPISVGIIGYEVARHDRINALIAAVGGPTKAAALLGKSRTHVDNLRKPDAFLNLEDALKLCVEAGVSLDWLATGHQVRPDLVKTELIPTNMIRLRPLDEKRGKDLEIPLAWLDGELGIEPADARFAILEDEGMGPTLPKGAMVLVDTRHAPFRSGLYLTTLGDEFVARRLNRLPDGRMELVADGVPSWRYPLVEGHMPSVLHRIIWQSSKV